MFPRLENKQKKGINQPKKAPSCQATPLLGKCPSSAQTSCKFEEEEEKEPVAALGLAVGTGAGGDTVKFDF